VNNLITNPETVVLSQEAKLSVLIQGSVMAGIGGTDPVSGIQVIAEGYWDDLTTYSNLNGNYSLEIPADFDQASIHVFDRDQEYVPNQETIQIYADDYPGQDIIDNVNFVGVLLESRLLLAVDKSPLKITQSGAPLAGSENVNISISDQTTPWGASVSDSWINLSTASGIGDGYFTILCDANLDFAGRIGQISITGGDLPINIMVHQAPTCPIGQLYNYNTSNCEKL